MQGGLIRYFDEFFGKNNPADLDDPQQQSLGEWSD